MNDFMTRIAMDGAAEDPFAVIDGRRMNIELNDGIPS